MNSPVTVIKPLFGANNLLSTYREILTVASLFRRGTKLRLPPVKTRALPWLRQTEQRELIPPGLETNNLCLPPIVLLPLTKPKQPLSKPCPDRRT